MRSNEVYVPSSLYFVLSLFQNYTLIQNFAQLHRSDMYLYMSKLKSTIIYLSKDCSCFSSQVSVITFT